MSTGFHSSPNDDPYIILGVSKDASADEIKKAFRKLALQHHPDKVKGNDSEFKRINNAYQILSDPDKRRLYDMCSSMNGDGINFDLNDLLTKLLNLVFQVLLNKKDSVVETKQAVKRNRTRDLHLQITVSLRELYHKQVKKLSIKVKRADEKGNLTIQQIPIYLSLLNYEDQYVYKGIGDEYIVEGNVVKSDVIVHLKVLDDPHIHLDKFVCKYDLYIEREMTLYQYYFGYDETIDYFGGVLQIKHTYVPSRDDHLRLTSSVVKVEKGYGLPYYDEEEGIEKRGDLYVYFRVKLPPKSNDVEFENILKAYFNDETRS